ncbi:MAG: FecR family protein [Bacteroidales bacterium]
MESKEQLQKLFQKYLHRKCSAAEIKLLLDSFGSRKNQEILKSAILQYFSGEAELDALTSKEDEAAKLKQVYAKVMSDIKKEKSRSAYRTLFLQRVAAAASILLFLSLGIFFYSSLKNNSRKEIAKNQVQPVKKNQKYDVEPGSNKGTLTLADGSSIELEKIADGEISTQGDVRIKKENNQLVYDASFLGSGKVIYNRVSIPRGGEYQLTLPDGTKVWLNAGSVIAYPVAFNGDERRVSIKGEAYFEVASAYSKDKKKLPFVVAVNQDAEVRVLGTHFNIKAYPGEGAIRTTLLEGSVEVKSIASNKSMLIQPGQQAVVDKDGALIAKKVNTEEVIAWKNGYFYFDNASLQDVLQQLARWYDVQVLYDGAIPDRYFTGKIRRNIYLSEALEILEFTRVNFRIEGKTIIVIP